jgi:hypothetical protein
MKKGVNSMSGKITFGTREIVLIGDGEASSLDCNHKI